MSSKGQHPPEERLGRGQRAFAGRTLAGSKAALNQQHHPRFGAPHFPPGENLPPQAKRLARRAKLRPVAPALKQLSETLHGDQAVPRASYPSAAPARPARTPLRARLLPRLAQGREGVDWMVWLVRRVGQEAVAWARVPFILLRLLWPFGR